MKILVVEDDPSLQDGLRDLLLRAGHDVTTAADGLRAVEIGTALDLDLVVLDRMLPKLDGVLVCQRLRTARPSVLVLMLTALGDEGDAVAGLGAGADDYVAKPFRPRELLARIEALGRRREASPRPPEQLVVDGCSLDLSRLTARREGREARLTPREAGILRLLHAHAGRPVTRQELLAQVWGVRPDVETRTVDVTIANLRAKIEREPKRPVIIVARKGVGYAWGGASGRETAAEVTAGTPSDRSRG